MAAISAFTDELYTVVENHSGRTRTFGFLGERGMRLAPGEAVAVRGDIVAKLGGTTSARKFKALERSLKRESIRIRSRPAPILWDAVTEKGQQIGVQNGTIGIVDPFWESSQSIQV